MTKGITVKRRFHVRRGRNSWRQILNGHASVDIQTHIPRVARLLALAIRFDQLIRDGVVADQADLARLGCVSRARLTQIMNLLNLASDIQEQILLETANDIGRDAVTERNLRPILAEHNWRTQRRLWIRETKSGPVSS